MTSSSGSGVTPPRGAGETERARGGCATRTRCQVLRTAERSLGRLGRNRDLAVDDLLLVVVELVGDVVDEATARGVAHAVDLEVVGRDAGGEGAAADLLEV